MKIFIRTTGDRSLEQFKDLDYTPLMDRERTGCKGYFKQLQELSLIEDDILLLEDDIKLKKSFFQCLNDVIEMSNNKYIINMSQPNGVIRFFEPKDFFWTRAVYYPKGSIKEFMEDYTEEYLKLDVYYDKIQQHLLKNKYIGVPSIMNIIDLELPPIMKYNNDNKK